MVDTARTRSALQALLPDNASGDISPQDLRDLLVSVFPPQVHAVSLSKSADQNVTSAATTKVTFDGTNWDTDSYFDNANDQIVIPTGLGGVYQVTHHLGLLNMTATDGPFSKIVAGTTGLNAANPNLPAVRFNRYVTGTTFPHLAGTVLIQADAGDSIQTEVTTTTDTNYHVRSSADGGTMLQAVYLGQWAV